MYWWWSECQIVEKLYSNKDDTDTFLVDSVLKSHWHVAIITIIYRDVIFWDFPTHVIRVDPSFFFFEGGGGGLLHDRVAQLIEFLIAITIMDATIT